MAPVRFYFPARSFTTASVAEGCWWRCNEDLDLINIWGETVVCLCCTRTCKSHWKHSLHSTLQDTSFCSAFRSLWGLKQFLVPKTCFWSHFQNNQIWINIRFWSLRAWCWRAYTPVTAVNHSRRRMNAVSRKRA